MPAYLPNSCDENVTDLDRVDSARPGAQNMTLSFPGCPSNSTEIGICFEYVRDPSCRRSSSNSGLSEKNLYRVISNTPNDGKRSTELIEKNGEIASNDQLTNTSGSEVTDVSAIDKESLQCRKLVHTLPMFARCSLQAEDKTSGIDRKQKRSASPRRLHTSSGAIRSSSLNWTCDRKKVLDGGRDDNTSRSVLMRTKSRGRGHKYKTEGQFNEDYGSSNAGVTNSSLVLYRESCYISPPRETMCGHQGDTRAIQISPNTGADGKDEKLTNESHCKNKYGSREADVPTFLEQEYPTGPQETTPTTQATSNDHRSPPHSRAKSKDHRLIDDIFLGVLKLLLGDDSGDPDLLPKPNTEMEFPPKRRDLADLNLTANHEQRETASLSRSYTDCSISRSSSVIHSLSEEFQDLSSKGNITAVGNSELNMLQNWKDDDDEDDDDDEYECMCCKAKKHYRNHANNNCHHFCEDDSNDECLENWDCLDSASSSGGSSRESLGSLEDANVHVPREPSSEAKPSKRPSVRDLVRSLQQKFSACTNPQPSEQSLDILPEWQFTCYNAPATASIPRATSSSHQDNLSELHSPQTSTARSFRDVVCSSERPIEPGNKINSEMSDKQEKPERSDKIYFSEPPVVPALGKTFIGNLTVTNLKGENKIPNANNENDLFEDSLTKEVLEEDLIKNEKVLLGEDNTKYSQVKQFLQHADQPLVVSRTAMPVPRDHVFDNDPVNFLDTTAGSYIHGRLLFSKPEDQSTDRNTPAVLQHLNISQDHPKHNQTSEDRQVGLQQANSAVSSGTGDKRPSESRWSSLLGATTCLDRMKATISKVRSKSVGPLMSKLSNVLERMKDVHMHANKSSSLSGILEDSSHEQAQHPAATRRVFDSSGSIPIEALRQHEGLPSIGSQTMDEPDGQSPSPVRASSSTSGDDHPPIFCLQISRTPSVRKTDRQLPRHYRCCMVPGDSMYRHRESTDSAQFVDRNELTKIQQTVLHKNVDSVQEYHSHNHSYLQSTTNETDMRTPFCWPNGNIVIEDPFLKHDPFVPLSNFVDMQVPISPSWGPPIISSEDSFAFEAPRLEETLLENPTSNKIDLEVDVESFSVQELVGVLDSRDNPCRDPDPFLRPFSSPTNYTREPVDTSLPSSLVSSVPEKSYSWLNVKDTTHTEPCLSEVMALVSEQTHIRRYPSFPDLTDINSDMSAALSFPPFEAADRQFLKSDIQDDADSNLDAAGTFSLPGQPADCMYETSAIYKTMNGSDSFADNKEYSNGSTVKDAEEGILLGRPELRYPQNARNELTANSPAETNFLVPRIIIDNATDANRGLLEDVQSCRSHAASLESDFEILSCPKIYTDLSSLASSIDKEQSAADNVLKGIYLLSPPCESVSENSWCNDAFGSQIDQSLNGSKMEIICKPNVFSTQLPSPPDHSLSENSWDNGDSDTQLDRSEKGVETSAPDNVSFQSTSGHTDVMSASSAHDKRLKLLRAAVTQDFGSASFGVSSDSFSSEERQLLGEQHTKPAVCSQREDSQSSELSISSLSYADNTKEAQDDDYSHLYVVDVFRDFRTDFEQPSADEISDLADRGNLRTSPGALVAEPNVAGECCQDCQLDAPYSFAAVEDHKASGGAEHGISNGAMFDKGNDIVKDHSKSTSVTTSVVADLGAAKEQAEDAPEAPRVNTDYSETRDWDQHDNDNVDTQVSDTRPIIIDKVLKSHSQIPGFYSKQMPSGATSDRHDKIHHGPVGQKTLNKHAKQIRWLDIVVPTDSGHSNTVSDSAWTGQCSSVETESPVPQDDAVLEILDATNISSLGTAKGHSSK